MNSRPATKSKNVDEKPLKTPGPTSKVNSVIDLNNKEFQQKDYFVMQKPFLITAFVDGSESASSQGLKSIHPTNTRSVEYSNSKQKNRDRLHSGKTKNPR